MWSGSVATIPTGWVLCNGSNSTPDLRDKFIIGAGNTYDVAATGGSKNSTLIAHTHTVTDGGHSHDGVLQAADDASGRRVTLNRAVGQNENDATGGNFGTSTDSASTGISINSTGSDNGVNSNLPPYYALCFIMKT
jgi:microcystin-dependent protein